MFVRAFGGSSFKKRYDVYGLPTVLDASGAPSTPDPRTSPLGNRFMFTGREWLSDLGLYDYRNRAYSPILGRWLQPDPIGFGAGDVNLYRFCANDSIGVADPSGLDIWEFRQPARVVYGLADHYYLFIDNTGVVDKQGRPINYIVDANEWRGLLIIETPLSLKEHVAEAQKSEPDLSNNSDTIITTTPEEAQHIVARFRAEKNEMKYEYRWWWNDCGEVLDWALKYLGELRAQGPSCGK